MGFHRDIFEPELKFVIEESSEVDGEHILGKVRGQFFVPEGVSRNKRFYSKGLWEKTLANERVKERLENRRMFGTISHEQKLDDTALLEGKVSHVLTNLSIDGNGKGIGEALILNTPAGQILNTVLRAGCKLFVSSRADGDFKGTFQGIPAVDPDKYVLETFDFVLEPGFLQANPSLVESMKEDLNYLYPDTVLKSVVQEPVQKTTHVTLQEDDKKEDLKMDKLVESLTMDKVKLTEQLQQVLGALEVEKAEKVSLASENSMLKEKVATVDADIATKALYERLGAPQEIEDAIDNARKVIEQYRALGSVEDIEKIFKIAEDTKASSSDVFKELGTPDEIAKALDLAESQLSAYKTFGTVDELENAFTIAEKTITDYQERGSVNEIDAVLEKAEKLAESMRDVSSSASIAKLAKDLGVAESAIRKVYGKLEEAEIVEMFSSLVSKKDESNDKGVERFRMSEDVSGEKKDTVSEDSNRILGTSRGSRLLEQFTR